VAGILPPWFPMGILPFPGFFTSICVTTGAGGFVGGLSGLACWGAEICAPVSCLGLPLGGCGGLFEGLGTAAGGLFQGCGDAINGCCHTLVL
jgi:hypothetical protein